MPRIHFVRRTFGLLVGALGVSGPASIAEASGTVSILNLGTAPAPLNVASHGEAVNNAGQVAGYSADFSRYRGYRTSANTPIAPLDDLGTLGGTKSESNAINNAGQVVGFSYLAGDSNFHAFRTTASGKIDASSDLGTLPTFDSTAADLNDSGQVVGSLVGDIITRAYRTTPGGVITEQSVLGSLGGNRTRAYGINASGQVTGYSTYVDSQWQRAYRTTATGGVTAGTDLGTLGGLESAGYDINDAGQVVGESATVGDINFHAFRTTATGGITSETDLGTLGGPGTNARAYGINNLGQVVGVSGLASGGAAAFFVDVTGGMIDLNSLLPANSGWYLLEARDINDVGQITGGGRYNGQTRAFLMTIPEPAGLGVAVAWVLWSRRRLDRRAMR